jgi:hypothetical protein
VTVNRAPLMTAWAFVVAERTGFRQSEALSIGRWPPPTIVDLAHTYIASAYTDMNAISKGVSLGIYEKGQERSMEATMIGAQSYADILGRRYVCLAIMFHRRVLIDMAPGCKPSLVNDGCYANQAQPAC